MVRVFLAQMEPVLCDKQANLRKMKEFIHQAASQKADLILFPELALTGYYTRENTQKLAEDEQGEGITQLRELAKKYRIKIIFGFPEKKDGKLFNSAGFIDNDGNLLGTYQKIHLWDEESKYFSAGESIRVWETDIGKIGIMICYDTEFPETARLLALKGAEIILAPTANMSPYEHVQRVQIPSRAVENQVFVATTNRIGTEESTFFFGESAAADPFGRVILLADQSEGGYLVEMDLAKIKEARKFPRYLQDRRPELYGNLSK